MRSAASSVTASLIDGGGVPTFAVVLAGGSGTRLWPLASASRPKQFLPLIRGKSLFQLTVQRIRPLFKPSRILVVCGAAHAQLVRRQAPRLPRSQVIVEASGRNTAASIALAALWIRRREPGAVMIVLPSDHWIEKPGAFRASLRRGAVAVRRHGGLLTLGVVPGHADTGYGYIGPRGPRVEPRVWRALRFVEKPPIGVARRMIRTGRVYWNSGIFIWRASGVLQELRRHRPKVLLPLERWAASRPALVWKVPATVLERTEAIPIDRAVLERSRNVLVAPVEFGWSDLGNWDAFGTMLRRDRNGNGSLGGLLALDSRRCLGINEKGLTVFVGVEDLIAVRSGEMMLVCDRSSAQRVRDVVTRLEQRRRRHPQGSWT